jgi:hypothetical protein
MYMKPLAEMVFIGEIVHQAKIAEWGAIHLESAHNAADPIEVWAAIQLILSAAGNVSKILWPSANKKNKTSKRRGIELRSLLGIESQNPLRDRRFRNHFEHYDARIEEWFSKNSSATYMDPVIDPFKPIWGKLTVRHRDYNPVTKVLTFRGESIDLGVVLNALGAIRHKCRGFALP